MYQLYDLVNLHDEPFREEIKKRLAKIVDTNAFIEGEYNTKFEAEFAEMQGSNFCRLVANGTDAIEIALKLMTLEVVILLQSQELPFTQRLKLYLILVQLLSLST